MGLGGVGQRADRRRVLQLFDPLTEAMQLGRPMSAPGSARSVLIGRPHRQGEKGVQIQGL